MRLLNLLSGFELGVHVGVHWGGGGKYILPGTTPEILIQ